MRGWWRLPLLLGLAAALGACAAEPAGYYGGPGYFGYGGAYLDDGYAPYRSRRYYDRPPAPPLPPPAALYRPPPPPPPPAFRPGPPPVRPPPPPR